MLEFFCRECRYILRVSDDTRESHFACPGCGSLQAVPAIEKIDLEKRPPRHISDQAENDIAVPDGVRLEAKGDAHTSETDLLHDGQTPELFNESLSQTTRRVQAPSPKNAGSPRPYSADEQKRSPLEALVAGFSTVVVESGYLTKALFGAVIVACIASWFVWQRNVLEYQEQRIAEIWALADGYFLQAQFEPAQHEYEQFPAIFTEWGRSVDANAELAVAMTQISSVCREIDSALNQPTAEIEVHLTALQDAKRRLIGDAAESSETPNSDSKRDEENSTVHRVGLEFPRSARWVEVVKWIDSRAHRIAQALPADPAPTANELARLEGLTTFLDDVGRDVQPLRDAAQKGRFEFAYQQQVDAFAAAAGEAVARADRQSTDAARANWSRLNELYADRIKPEMWSQYTEKLQHSILQRLKAKVPADGVTPLGSIDTAVLPLLSTPDAKALSTGSAVASAAPAKELVFVRVEDRCYALNAGSGEPVWVCRVGFDTPGSPVFVERAGGDVLVVPWDAGDGPRVSAVSTTGSTALWTLHLPSATSLASGPIVIGENVYIASTAGAIWQVNLNDGRCAAFLELPENLAGPLVFDFENRVAIGTGRELAIYVFDLHEVPRVRAVALRPQNTSDETHYSVWVNPFLLHFQNDAAGHCVASVYRSQGENFSQVQSLQLAGKLWQAPVVRGTSLFLMTDAGVEAFYRLRIDHNSQPLTAVYKSDSAKMADMHPYFLSHAEVPYVTAIGSSVNAFSIDPLQLAENRVPKKIWAHELRLPGYLVFRELQATPTGVVIVAQRPRFSGVLVECISSEDGSFVWQRNIGVPAARKDEK